VRARQLLGLRGPVRVLEDREGVGLVQGFSTTFSVVSRFRWPRGHGGVFEGDGLAHDDFQVASDQHLREFRHCGQYALGVALERVTEVEAEDGLVLEQESRGIDASGFAAGRAVGHDAPEVREGVEAPRERLAAHAVEDEVDALAVGNVSDFLGEVGRLVVDGMVTAEALGESQLLVGARRPEDLRARGRGELDRRGADPARRRVNQNAFACFQSASLVEDGVGGQELD
jgi:hypothetical protein